MSYEELEKATLISDILNTSKQIKDILEGNVAHPFTEDLEEE